MSLISTKASRLALGLVWTAVGFSQPAFAAPATVAQNSATIGLYEVYELTLTSDSQLYANPWTDAVITAIFRSPSGKTSTIGGFYYDTDAFKVRFTPRETGAWTWTLSMTGSGSFNTSGQFTAVGSKKKGFMRADPGRPRTFYTEGNGKSFHGIGINDCWNGNYFLDVQNLDVGLDAYFDTWNAAGNNFYRFGFSNCADYVFAYAGLNVNNSGTNRYDVDVGKRFDALATKLRALDWKMMVSFVGTGSGFVFDLSDPAYRQAVLHMHKYIIDRWGAYVDFWELTNEVNPLNHPTWLDYATVVTTFVRGYDPYRQLLGTSSSCQNNYWSCPSPAFDVNSDMHAYMPCNGHEGCTAANTASGSLDLDAAWVQNIDLMKAATPLPLIAGEAGNHGCNGNPAGGTDPLRERYRIGLWVTFFNQVIPVWWNSTSISYCASAGNIYIGPDERRHSRVFADYIANFDLRTASNIPLTLSDPTNSRGYGMAGATDLGAWFVHSTSHLTPLSGGRVTLTIPASLNGAPGYWLDTNTGAVLGKFTAISGQQTLTIPPFTIDIALRIHRDRDGEDEVSAK